MEFNFTKLIFSIRLKSDVGNPYLLFDIRKGFTEVFRLTVGCDRSSCDACKEASDCTYREIFSQEMSPDPSAIRRFQKPPLPFAFDIPVLPSQPNRGRTVEVGLVLAGRAVNHILHFVRAVDDMLGPEGGFGGDLASVIRVESVDYLGNRMIIAMDGSKKTPDQLFVLSMDGLDKSAILSTDSVKIRLETPLRIIKDGRPARELAFPALAMSLIRRMSAMAYYYSFMDLNLEYAWLSRLSGEIMVNESDFKWVEWGNSIGGILGYGTFSGNMVEFHPFLLFGEYFHGGKGAAYGLGRFRLENPS